MKRIYIILSGIVLLLSSCAKDKTNQQAGGRVIVLNEGGYGHGDASVSVYDPATKVVSNDVFLAQNGFVLGDVAQSLYLQGDTAYVVMNNSRDIVIADATQNFRYLGHIAIPNSSPRYFMPVSATKAYVTELYANKIWIVDYKNAALTGSIPTSGWTEQILSYNGKVYVLEQTKPGGTAVHKILMIDPATDQVLNSVDLPTDPSSLVVTDDHRLFVLTSRQSSPAVPANLYQLNPATLAVSARIDFDSTQSPSRLRYSSVTHQLLFAGNGIYAMTSTDTILPSQPLIPSGGWNVYGLNADPANGDIYISDAIDYQQASRIMRYSKEGVQIDAFNAGLITNGFTFK